MRSEIKAALKPFPVPAAALALLLALAGAAETAGDPISVLESSDLLAPKAPGDPVMTLLVEVAPGGEVPKHMLGSTGTVAILEGEMTINAVVGSA